MNLSIDIVLTFGNVLTVDIVKRTHFILGSPQIGHRIFRVVTVEPGEHVIATALERLKMSD